MRLARNKVTAVTARAGAVTPLGDERCNPQEPSSTLQKSPMCMHGEPDQLVVPVTAVTSVSKAEFARLANVSLVAIQKAIAKQRIDVEVFVPEAGNNKGRPLYKVILESGFKAYPQAKQRWVTEHAANVAALRMRETEQSRQAATRQVAREVRLADCTEVAAARAWHVTRFKQYMTEIRETKSGIAGPLYLRAIASGDIAEVPAWVTEAVGEFSLSTLRRWSDLLQAGGVAGLEPKWKGGRSSTLEVNPEMGEFALGLLLQMPHLSAARIREALVARYGEGVPSATAVGRWLKRWKEENPREFLMATNPDAAKNKYQAAMGSRSEDVTELNQRWETDATKVDLFFQGDPRRWTLCAVVDVYSDRRRFLLAESAKGMAHGLLLRRAILDWGLPQQVKTDNGKDYTSKYMTRFFADLGIEQVLCRPFSGEEKPHVERGFRTFLHDLVELLPGFAGHNVSQAQDLRAQKSFEQRLKDAQPGDAVEVGISREAFIDFMDAWILADEARVRESGRLKGKSPAQVVNEWASERPIRRIKDPLVLDWLLCEAHTRTIQKKGIAFDGRFYIAPELDPLVGRQVEFRVTPEDIGRISVFYQDAFLCIAEAPEITGIKPAEVAAKGRALRKAGDQAVREFQKQLKRQVGGKKAVVDAIVAERMKAVDQVQQFQVPEHVETVGMAAVAAAATADALAKVVEQQAAPTTRQLPMSPEQEQAIRERIAPKQKEEDPSDRYIRLRRMTLIPANELPWIEEFETQTETGRALKRLMDDLAPKPQALKQA